MKIHLALGSILAVAAMPAAAQQPAAPTSSSSPVDPGDEDETEIVVNAQVPRGSVAGDIRPELQLGPADIRALGASSVTELLAELAPQLGGGDSQPIVLLEGKRISGFREIATLPSEAIARVDILPAEVALKYGYPTGQKVVNIVLRQRFRAYTVELEDRLSISGGANNAEASFGFLRIAKGGRINIDLKYESTTALLESQRGIDDGNGAGQFRTLLPSQGLFTATAVWNRTVFDTVSATLNGQLQTDDSEARLGLPVDTVTNLTYPDFNPLARRTGTQAGRAGITLNGDVQGWRWAFTGNYEHEDTKTFVDGGINAEALRDAVLGGNIIADPFGRVAPQFLIFRPADRATSVSDLATMDFTVSGALFALPAGDVSTTAKLGASFSGFASDTVRLGLAQSGRVSRDIADGQISIDVPIASRRRAVLHWAGDLSLNGNYALRRLSDYGTLRTFGYGLTWSPIRSLELIASMTDDEVAPSAPQIGNPVIATPGVRVFDFASGATAVVTQITGGNPGLRPSDTRRFKLGLNLKPFTSDLTFTADYLQTRTRNGINSLPPATLASQGAFADRYVRDGAGMLVSLDNRAVNFARAEASQLRTGINFSKPLKTSQAQIDALRAAFRARSPDGPPRLPGDGLREGGRRGGGGAGGFGGGGGGRLNLALYHTWHFTDEVTLRDGFSTIDLLRGGTIGSGGGQSRHEVELQAGVSKNGFGTRLTGNWRSATRVDGATPNEDLRFSGLGTLNLRLFANIGQVPSIIKSAPWLRGTRVTIGINNLFDSRQRVTDSTGATPLSYSPGYIDPLGRTVRISIRKLFF